LKATVTLAQRPEVVIYGLAPRDFYDSTMSSPADTEAFSYLKRVITLDEVAKGFYRDVTGKLDWWLQHAVYLYGNSLSFQLLGIDSAREFLATAVPAPYTDKPFTWWDRKRLLPKYFPNDILEGSFMTAPQKRWDRTYTDNTQEYRERYKSPDSENFKTQFYFLRQLAAYCRRENIELIVVNMPITLQNVNLLKPHYYYNYLVELTKVAQAEDVTLLNA